MRDIPKKNCKVGAIGFLFAALCNCGAAIFYARESKNGLFAANCSIAMLYIVAAAVLLKKSRQA